MEHLRDAFLALLRMELCGVSPDEELLRQITPEHLQALYRISKMHDMGHLVGSALQKVDLLAEEDPLTQDFRKMTFIAAFRYQQMKYEYERMCELFETEGVDFLPLKGSVIRPFYPDPTQRTSCDIDILIRKEQLDPISALLSERLEYSLEERNPHEYSFRAPNRVHLELHFDLLSEDDSNSIGAFQSASMRQFDRIWEVSAPMEGKQHHYEMPRDYYYAYLMAHAAKHILTGGCGLRPFMDIWVMRYRMNYDVNDARPLLKKCGLSAFAETMEHTSDVWFSGAEHTPLSEQTEKYILTSGTYGNLKNKIISSQTQKGSRFHYVLSRIFHPYKQMKYSYPILQKHPILLPLYEVIRWFQILFSKRLRGAATELKLNRDTDEAEVRELKKYYKSLKL